MTRSDAIVTITSLLEHADDATLQAAARHLATLAGKPPTVEDVLESFPTESTLPRDLTALELALIEQSKKDFRQGRTRSSAESRAWVDAELERRRSLRSGA